MPQTVEANLLSEDLLENDGPSPESEAVWDSPEKHLWYTVLFDGIQGSLRGNVWDRDWIRSEAHDRLNTFVCLCELFQVDPARVRRVLTERWVWGKEYIQKVNHTAGRVHKVVEQRGHH
jgi:hypothetical protein